jgi:hypothetical protein
LTPIPSPVDVVWDFDRKTKWQELDWIKIRRPRNKWSLLAQYPEHKEAILGTSDDKNRQDYDPEGVEDLSDTDFVYVDEFYHKPTPALADGRMVVYIADTELYDDINPYRGLPVYPLRLGKVRKTLLGWTPAFELQKQQELLNELLSKIATIRDNLGLPLVWTHASTKQPDPEEWVGNIAFVESESKPELIELSHVPPEMYRELEIIVNTMKEIIGLNDAAMGQAEGSIRANQMQLFAEQQVLRFNSPITKAYYGFLEAVGTAHLELLQDFPRTKRTISIVGKRGQSSLIEFTADDLYDVTGVTVDIGSEITQTLPGRIQVMELMRQNQIQMNKEDLVAILNGAPLDVLTEGVQGELDTVNSENEELLEGRPHRAIATDPHLLHIRKHVQVLSTPQARRSPELTNHVLAAVMEHHQLYNTPGVFDLQLDLGYAELPPNFAQGKAGPAGGGPAPTPEQRLEAPSPNTRQPASTG